MPRKRLAIVGRGRLGTALAAALDAVGYEISGPLGRDPDTTGAEAVLLCVPDGEIARAAAKLEPGSLVGHCSGATGLDVLAPHEAFSFHPLMTVNGEGAMTVTGEGAMTVTGEGALFAGAGAAIAGSTARALTFASELASALRMNAVDAERAADLLPLFDTMVQATKALVAASEGPRVSSTPARATRTLVAASEEPCVSSTPALAATPSQRART